MDALGGERKEERLALEERLGISEGLAGFEVPQAQELRHPALDPERVTEAAVL